MGTRNKLTATSVKNEKRSGRHSDGAGLYLRVKNADSKTWSYMWKRNNLQREISLGPYPDVSLKLAREKAQTAREAIQSGEDPKEALSPPSVKTFLEVAQCCLNDRRLEESSPKTKRKWERTVNEICKPLHKRPISGITRVDALKLLRPIWNNTPETGRIVRSQMDAIFSYAKSHGWYEGENPVLWKGGLDGILKLRSRKNIKHLPALPYAELGEFMDSLKAVGTMSALALQFVILTATRSNETRSAEWSEFDLAERTWTIPKHRMKAREEHRIPLSNAAMEILEQVEGLDDKWVFPSPRAQKPLTDVALAKTLKRFHPNVDATVHGFRSTFRDWCEEQTSFAHAVKERALAHSITNQAEAAYHRTELFEKRKELMEAWGRFAITVENENGIQLRKGG